MIICALDKLPPESLLEKAQDANGDGGGVAWVEDGLVRWKKGLTVKEMMELDIKLPAVFHFRIATQGASIGALTHPFPVTAGASVDLEGKANRVLFHNGNWSDWKPELKAALISAKLREKAPRGPWSDSRAMAFIASIAGEGYLNLISHGWQRIAILDGRSATVRFYGDEWKEHEGFLVSNDNFLSRSSAGRGFAADSEANDMAYEGGGYANESEFREITSQEIRDLDSLTIAQRQQYWQGNKTLQELVAENKQDAHETTAST